LGNGQHLCRGGHFQVYPTIRVTNQRGNIMVTDMTAVLAQVNGYAVRASLNGQMGSPHRVWMNPAPRIAQRRHVVDINP
jgi:hypothetical protein